MRIEGLLRDSARIHGAKAAVVAGRVAYSYGDLDRKSDRLAAALKANGVESGGRVAVYLDNSFAAVVSAFAVFKAGAILCQVEPSTPRELLASVFARGGISGVITEARLAAATAAVLVNAPQLRVLVLVGGDHSSVPQGCLSYERAVEGFAAAIDATSSDCGEPAVIFGVVNPDGPALGTMLTHRDLIAELDVVAPGQDDAPRFTQFPLSSLYGFYGLVAAVRAGATLILEDAGRPPYRGRRAEDIPGAAVALAG